MTPDNPFLPALLADPDDDTLRLALADWLDEHDDDPGPAGRADSSPGAGPGSRAARAEFIRVQIALARGASDPDSRWYLDRRQSALLSAHDAEWVAPLEAVLGVRPGEWSGWAFRRGFVEYFHLPVNTLVNCGAQLARLTPVRELNLDDPGWRLDELWRQPWLRSVTHLSGLYLSNSVAEAMIACPHLTGLRVLKCDRERLDARVRRWFVRRFGHALPAE